MSLIYKKKLFHSYIRRNKGCLFVGPLNSEYRRVVSDVSGHEYAAC